MKGGLRTGWLIALILVGLVPLTLRAIAIANEVWQLTLDSDMRMSDVGGVIFFALLSVGMVISVGIDWYLMVGLIRRGREWLATRALWIKWFGLSAPVGSLLISVRSLMAVLHRYGAVVDPSVSAGLWGIEFLLASLQLLSTLALTIFFVSVTRMALRRH